MSIRVTDKQTFALYDSVTGFAFGPTFDSELDADEFVEWCDAQGYPDLRSVSDRELEAYHSAWWERTGRSVRA